MDSQTRLGLELFGAALVLGMLGDQLLRVGPWGLNAFVWIGCLVVVSCGLGYRWWAEHIRVQPWFILPLGGLALLYLGRDAATLKLVNSVAVLAALALGVWQMQRARLRRHPSVAVEPPGLLAAGIKALFEVPRFLTRDIDWKSLKAEERGKKAAAVARGVLIALPVLVLFGTLFVAADAAFASLLAHTFEIDPTLLPGHLLLTVLFTWIVGGFLYGVLINKTRAPEEADGPVDDEALDATPRFSLGIVEVSVVLGLVNALFATFVLVQLSYFFGGHHTVLDTAGLTLAAYARSGFFELVMVVSLALPFMLGLRRLLAVKAGRPLRLFHALAGVQVGLLFLILASAAQRMWLYQHIYGLTELRLYVSSFIVWLAFVLGWFLLSVLRDRVERFMPGAVAAGFVVVVGLHLINPDALIVKTNVARAAAGAPIDTAYLTHLSADAVPALLDALPVMEPEIQAAMARQLIDRWHRPASADWRTWSRARAQAWHAVEDSIEVLHQFSHNAEARHPALSHDRHEALRLMDPLPRNAAASVEP